MIGAALIYTVSMSSLTPLVLMTHEMDPTMKIWSGCRRDEEPVEKAILFDKEIACTPLPAHQLSIEYRRQSSKGYPTKVD